MTNNCPPPQIVYMSDCYDAYECPPGAQSLEYGWENCELPNGTVGQQKVTCDKGQLYFSACQGCTAEVCDKVDNDCDGQTDEDLGVFPCQTDCGPGEGVCKDGTVICYGAEPGEEICDYKDNDCDGETDEGQTNACGLCGALPNETCDNIDNDCNGITDEDLYELCETECESGLVYCNNGQWSGCTAQVPEPEICDGKDNDCNGFIDENLDCLCTKADVGILTPCFEEPLLCGQGFKMCQCEDEECNQITMSGCYAICYWLSSPYGSNDDCDELVGFPLDQEICNNFDDDCDTEIDEDLYSSCYTGPDGTLGLGICKPGIAVCESGKWGSTIDGTFIPDLCSEEVLPIPEECNGIDDDCDGLTDWNQEPNETDVLFIVDWSGSMLEEINSVLAAMNQFSSNYELEDKIQWGLIIGPKTQGKFDQLELVINISPLDQFLAMFGSLGQVTVASAYEMLLDALYLSIRNITNYDFYDISSANWSPLVSESIPPKDVFTVNWRPDADRIIILMSDESPQSFLQPKVNEEDIASMCAGASSLKVHTFSVGLNWGYISNSCNGTSFPLDSSAAATYDSLMQILEEICKPSPQ